MGRNHDIWIYIRDAGTFVIFERLGWGIIYTLAGLVGLIVLIRHRVRKSLINMPFRTPIIALACLVISLFVGQTVSQITMTHNAVVAYVLPRQVTEKQAINLANSLSHHEAHSVTVKAYPLDAEAIEYAAQILNALKRSDWNVDFSTSDGEPYTLNAGTCIYTQGQVSVPNDAKHDPGTILQQAFRDAQIEVNCGGGVVAGNFKLFVLVGHRPLVTGRTRSIQVGTLAHEGR